MSDVQVPLQLKQFLSDWTGPNIPVKQSLLAGTMFFSSPGKTLSQPRSKASLRNKYDNASKQQVSHTGISFLQFTVIPVGNHASIFSGVNPAGLAGPQTVGQV